MSIDPEELAFYMSLFEGETVVLADVDGGAAAECKEVAAELARAGAHAVVVERVPGLPHGVSSEDLLAIWRALQGDEVAVLGVQDVAREAAELAGAGRVGKLVLVGAALPLRAPDGRRRSFVDVAAAGLPGRLVPFVRPLYEGVQGVNLVAPGALREELFSYAGAGTLLTLGDYGEIRPLGFDDYAPVAALLRRGMELGYLRRRPDAEAEALLPRSLGFFVGGSVPAGVVALLEEPYAGSGFGELEGLFTVSRFQGEGIGRRLVEALGSVARDRGLDSLFAVTGNDEALRFFRSCGFERGAQEALPVEKWSGYPVARRAIVKCLIRQL